MKKLVDKFEICDLGVFITVFSLADGHYYIVDTDGTDLAWFGRDQKQEALKAAQTIAEEYFQS